MQKPKKSTSGLFVRILAGLTAALFLSVLCPSSQASDPEGCLVCHRYRGLSRLDPVTEELRLFFCSEEYYAYQLGPHARLRCTDCHKAEEVSVVPHRVKTPVNCTQECHVSSPEWLEKRFSHQDVMRYLEGSAHTEERLRTLQFDPPLLRDDLESEQAVCLYCHDEPLFRWAVDRDRMGTSRYEIHRCQTCHRRELPIDMVYYVRHFGSRLQPARPTRQLIQVCAVCHSDPAILSQMSHHHDTVASYLHSFHGKAQLLGNKKTATCLDCHVSEIGNAHAMLLKENPQSSVNPRQVSDTCRSARCHPGASPAMSKAAVHLPIDPQARTPEFYVAAFFVLLTAVVMGLFFLIIILELLGGVVRRSHPEDQRLARLAKLMQQDPEGRKLLQRLTVHQRIQHWLLAVTFIVLVYTGMCIKFADMSFSRTLVNIVGGLSMARRLHRISGVTMLAGFGYHILYVIYTFVSAKRQARREGNPKSYKQLILESPMMIRLQDFKDLFRALGYLMMFRRVRPKFGHFSFMEKFEYWAVSWGCIMIGATGAMLWATEGITKYLSGRALNFAYIIHSDEAYLAFIYIAVVHMFKIIFAPAVFPLSSGTLTGQAPPHELAEWHAAKVEEVAAQLHFQAAEPQHKKSTVRALGLQILKRSYSFVLLVLTLWISYTSLHYLFSILLHREVAPTEIVDIPKRLTADTLRESSAHAAYITGTTEALTRGPLAHFHQIPPWFQPDPTNNCTTAGCHAPLPHGRKIETRAFLNMHATFLDCGVCHNRKNQDSLPTAWYDLQTGERHATPAVLQLADYLEQTDQIDSGQARAVNERLIQYLQEAVEQADENAQLKNWLLHLETTNADSKLWRSIVNNIRTDIYLHLHGEYHAKIALDYGDHRRPELNPKQKAAAHAYRKKKDKLSASEKQSLLDEVHQGVSSTRLLCTPCHNIDSSLINFKQLGYPLRRVGSLRDSPIARQMEQIQQGRKFIIGPHYEKNP